MKTFTKAFYFSLLYLILFSTSMLNATTNAALTGTATQSSLHIGGEAFKAIDNNTDGLWNNNSVTHTQPLTPYDWWQVDLGSIQSISEIKLYNRDDCCEHRLNNVWVMISDTPFSQTTTSASLTASRAMADWSDQVNPTSPDISTFTLTTPTAGRYVLIQKNGTYLSGEDMALSLAEVEVFTTPIAPNLSIPDLDQCGMFMSVLTTYDHMTISQNDVINSCTISYPLDEYTAGHDNSPRCYSPTGELCPNNGECVRVDPPSDRYNHSFISTTDISTNTTSASVTFNDLEYGNYSLGGNNGTIITFDPQISYNDNARKVMLLGDFEFTGNSQQLIFEEGDYYFKSLNLAANSVAMEINGKVNIFVESNFEYAGNSATIAGGEKSLFIYVGGDAAFSGFGGGNSWLGMFIYVEGDTTIDANSNVANLYGGITTEGSITITGNNMNFIYNEEGARNLNDEECPYCIENGLSDGFQIIDPDGGDNTNSFEIYCENGSDYIALPIKNESNNFVFDSAALTSVNYYDRGTNGREDFQAIKINANTMEVLLGDSQTPTAINSGAYFKMGSTFSNINLIGTPFAIDWDNTTISICTEAKLRKAYYGQAVKINTLDYDAQSICHIDSMKIKLLDDYRYLTYSGSEVLQGSCKKMAEAVPNNVGILNDEDIQGHFFISPFGHNRTYGATDIGSNERPIVSYCWYQTDLEWVWTFFLGLDGAVTNTKDDLVRGEDTCSEMGLYFFVPNSKETFDRVRKYLLDKKSDDNGWENYTGTINEKLSMFHGLDYYLSGFWDVSIWPYGPFGIYYPTNGDIDINGNSADWGDGVNSAREYMSGSPMHNIPTAVDYSDSMGYKGWKSILEDLGKTTDWWIADIGAGEEIGLSTPTYSPSGVHPIQSTNYKYYEPNGNYTANAWLNFLYDSQGWVYHNDDAGSSYPYYDYMCMSETNYDTTSRHSLVPGFFNAIESGNIITDTNLTTKIVDKNISLDLLLYEYDAITGLIDTTTLENDENRSVGVFLSYIESSISSDNVQLSRYLGEYIDFSSNNGRISIPTFTSTSAHQKSLLRFYFCEDPTLDWKTCWLYNGNPTSPTISEITGEDANSTDSYDYFAIRPERFNFTIENGLSITAGSEVDIDFEAISYNDINTSNYNEIQNGSFTVDINISDPSKNCPVKSLDMSPAVIFSNGVNSYADYTFDEIGDYNI